MTRADTGYPRRLKQRLKHAAPAILFGAGEQALLGQPGLAVVGSRNVDDQGKTYADYIGNACAREGLVLYSGGARGVDAISTNAALEARGTAVGVLAHSLEKAIRAADARPKLVSGDLALVTPYSPNAGFSVGAAMGRNKLVYALADYALVIASDVGKGGTWAGAMEALKAKWSPVFVLDGPDVPIPPQEPDPGPVPTPIPTPVPLEIVARLRGIAVGLNEIELALSEVIEDMEAL